MCYYIRIAVGNKIEILREFQGILVTLQLFSIRLKYFGHFWILGATPPLPHVIMALCLIEHRNNFTFTNCMKH
jgi:hypothetical protein